MEKTLKVTNEFRDHIDVAVNTYKCHPSIQLIKRRVTVSAKFAFRQYSLEEILYKVKDLDPIKASPFGNIPVKILTEHSELLAPSLQLFINESIDIASFQHN